MMEYLLKIKSIVDNLLAIGENITEQDWILYLLAGLRAKYNSFVITITSGHEPLSLEEIHSMFLTHENRLEQQHTTEETNLLQANFATMNIQGQKKIKSLVNSRLKVEVIRINNNLIIRTLVEAVGEATITTMVGILDMVQEEVALTTILTHVETSIKFLVAAMENHSAKYVVNMVTLRLIAIIDLIKLINQQWTIILLQWLQLRPLLEMKAGTWIPKLRIT